MYQILVIEDETSIRQNLLDLLALEDFKVISAENGQIGLQLAQQTIPDLIICDVMMPELDGHNVLKILRQEPTTATIPFIFLTAKSDKTDFRQGMELGADDYLTKPFTRAELLTAITSRLEKQAVFNQQSQQKLDDLRSSITLSLPHEMRTPLNGILGFSELLIKDVDILNSHEIREMAEGIHKSATRLLRLIQNFLLYAELEIISSAPERINLMQSYRTVFPTVALTNLIIEKAKQVGRTGDLQVNLSTNCSLKINETKLYKIIEELIDNALKFSSLGTIIQVNTASINNKLILSFLDHGRGMTSAQISELGAYRQFERKLYEQQGSGLGLIIAKRLVELHGGELKINSQPNEKTLVQVVLPCDNS
ncbi:response regulator [Aetokthonos hydrillicola Thurmond2011]|jgi:signal transduction histidine kinase|uniref:histidine kinase n=1 Tax=Aetokthonos hydrillicola Thurmond2011 TaxID=2712845 RepID=A0AAP5IHJ7_9CYAN|nr:response regulator [Aetokthonos hydrillicola]MBO3458097.1 hybrid sensor histidine kinase/response regulator [Aetokthonos hydrillicola CCALA 1050]MBW4587066.1 response regulator [Aetokthonos hydrillicola CCALA 1050]MDR9899685.1 response regulator [Aetokthonos hydrillicola Thurmond2011]